MPVRARYFSVARKSLIAPLTVTPTLTYTATAAPAAVTYRPPTVVPAEPEPPTPEAPDYGAMRRKDLLEVAEGLGLATYGTREQLLARIEAATAEPAA